ncbi:MAG TPA: DNA mismatch repair protein MutT, partial [Oceanithermus profundus]|nr:DNA mismatch repair protein MutT [Oceanithermus profundus]
ESPTETVTPNEEIAEWAWVPPRAALDYPLNRYTTPLVARYLEVKGG